MLKTDLIKIEVNGTPISILQDKRVLDAINLSEQKVPTLCFDERIGPQGTCRMCLVEVKIKEQLSYVASCTAMVEENMEVFTHSDSLIEYRKTLLELTLSEIKWDQKSMDDTSLTNNEFKMAVEEYKPTNFFPKLQTREKVKDENPFINRDYDKCIACYRCTNICNDWEQASAITIDGRGQDSKIFSFFDNELMNSNCTFCGQCINTCPTGALVDKKILNKTTPSKLNRTKTICPYCGVGCGIHLLTEEGEIKGVEPDFDSPSRGSLCVKGQFASWEFVKSEQRLKSPLIKKKGEFIKSSWSEALNLVAKKFSSIKEKNGPDSLVLWSSARVVTEANYLMQKFARVAIGTNNIDNCSRT